MYQITPLTILRERRARRARAVRIQRRLQFELDRDIDRRAASVVCIACRMVVPANEAHTCPTINVFSPAVA